MKVIISDKIYLEKSKLTREIRTAIRKNYSFKDKNSYGDKIIIRSASGSLEKDGITYLTLPPNLSYFQEFMNTEFPELHYELSDERVCPKVEGFKSNIIPRDNQISILNDLEKVEYNAIMSAKTGAGKTTMALYLTEKLQTNMLFVATRTSLITNLLKDAKQFGIDEADITEINAEWLKNPKITTIMYCTVQALSDEICEKLYNKVGLLVADEVHLGISGEGNSEKLFNINPKHRLYLSATYKNLSFEGLNECLLSNNIVDADEEIDYDIEINHINFYSTNTDIWEYKREYTNHKKKELFYEDCYLRQTSNLAYWKIKVEKRGVLIYVENKYAQEELENNLRFCCLKVGLLNSKTKKKESEAIINKFDSGEYDVIIAGSSISAGVSLYRLSCIINLNVTTNSNNLTQLLGRLKRKNDEICNKTKEYFQFTRKGMNSDKWVNDKKCLFEFPYFKFNKEILVDEEDCWQTLEVYKKVLNLN